MEKELRRSRSTLRIVGGGVILFTLWDFLKPFLFALMVSEETSEVQPGELLESIPAGILIVILLVILLLSIQVPLLRIWIGRSAMAEGTGKKKGRAYMYAAFVLAAMQLTAFTAALLFVLLGRAAEKQDLLQTAASLLVECSSMLTMAETALTARKVKRLEEQLREAG